VRRARRLRGGRRRGLRALRGIAMPVLADAMDRSLALAAAMDSRGYGRNAGVPRRVRLTTGALVVVGLLGVAVGVYGVLDATTPRYLGLPMLVLGLVLAGAGLPLAGRRVRRSVYRPDRWRAAETLVTLSGAAAAVVLAVTGRVDAAGLSPSLSPLSWPGLPALPALGVLLALLPAWLAPPPPPTVAVTVPAAQRVPAGAVR
ncbi:MAG TPA: hypothetical protein VEL73_07250, partial [Mycobacteriales bacterium]|nr:hypothetical protein [Mycobacteriales bacterium]